jgi:spermidine synthase
MFSFLRKVFPEWFPAEKVQTRYNQLEVIRQKGQWVLNAPHVNYSFGSLHRVFQSAFQELKPDLESVRHVLILGFGAGSVAQILQHEMQCRCSITGVEIDEKIVELGQKYFRLSRLKNLTLVVDDAADFLSRHPSSAFDLIVVDVFLDHRIPEKFLASAFLQQVDRHLAPGGQVLFNYLLYDFRARSQKAPFEKAFRSVFQNVRIIAPAKQPDNIVFAGRKRKK